MERKILRFLLLIGIGLLPILVRKRPIKDWFIVFFLKGYSTSFVDSIITSEKRINYPIRFLPKHFRISVLFDYLLFPIVCVAYNQATQYSSLSGIILKSFFFSIPMTIVESILHRYTKLISYKKNWCWYHTLITESFTFFLSRAGIGLVHKLEEYQSKDEDSAI